MFRITMRSVRAMLGPLFRIRMLIGFATFMPVRDRLSITFLMIITSITLDPPYISLGINHY